MVRAKITSKGQITLPKSVRERLHVGPGDRVSFRLREDGTISVEADPVDPRDLFGVLSRYARPDAPLTVEEMDDAIAEYVAADDARIRRGDGG